MSVSVVEVEPHARFVQERSDAQYAHVLPRQLVQHAELFIQLYCEIAHVLRMRNVEIVII